MDISTELQRIADTLRQASTTRTAAGLSDETKSIAKKALRLTDEYHREIQALVKRAQAECESLEEECDEKQPERFSDAKEAQWWVNLQGRKVRAVDLCKLLKDICYEDLAPSVSAKGALGQFMKD